MLKLADKYKFVAKNAIGYTADIIARRLCSPHWGGMRWSDVPSRSLRAVSADEKECLEKLPSEWSAAQVSSFICQRPDWGYLASMYTCVWKEVADHIPDAKEQVARLSTLPPSASTSGPSPLLQAAQALLCQYGIAMHPTMLMKDVQSRNVRASTPDATTEVSARASTPSSQGKTRARASTPVGKTNSIKRARSVTKK